MADDWQTGDLAQCIKTHAPDLVVGRIYRVSVVIRTDMGVGLLLEDNPCVCPLCGGHDTCSSFRATLFRKIRPPKEEKEKFDFRTLLAPKKVKELEPA